jgi:tetratricopeptide (TPR) repeat protein
VLDAGGSTPEKPVPGTIPFELDTGRIEEALEKVGSELVRWAKKGRYTKVRLKFRGRQLLPDIPLAALVAAEGLSFYWAGLLRALAVNVAGGALIDVELVNDSEKVIAQGREALLSGEVEKALEHFRKATEMDRDNADAWLNLGVASKLRGDLAGARNALEKARTLGANSLTAAEAERILKTLGEDAPRAQPPHSVDSRLDDGRG